MKNLLLSTFLLLAFTSTAFAQDSDSDNAQAEVEVLKALEVTKQADIDFGAVFQNDGSVTLDPTTGATGESQGATSAGKFQISGTAGEDVQLDFPTSVTLNNADASASITFTTDLTGLESDNQSGSQDVQDGDTRTLSSSTGLYFVWVGGTIDVTTATPDTYTGTFTLTASYTNL